MPVAQPKTGSFVCLVLRAIHLRRDLASAGPANDFVGFVIRWLWTLTLRRLDCNKTSGNIDGIPASMPWVASVPSGDWGPVVRLSIC